MASAAKLLVLLATHPDEVRAVISYKLWYDPLHRPEDHVETSRWDKPTMKRCWKLLDMTSRSFAAVIKELEGDLCRAVAIFYLVLRGLDTIEDDMTLGHDLKIRELRDFYKRLEEPGWTFTQSGPNEKDRELLIAFDVVIEEYGLLQQGYQRAIQDVCRQMGRGMAHYANLHKESNGNFSVDTLASYDLYCHYVAGLVGEGLSRLFSASGLESPQLGAQLTLANSMGLHLQKTNVMRDFREDLDDGRLFWPKEIWGKYVARPQDLYAPGNEKKARWALTDMAMDAATHSVDALDYLSLLRNQSVFTFCAIPQVMALATLDECFGNLKVVRQNVKIRKSLAVSLIMRATNCREVAIIFRHYALRMHAKSLPSDPCYLRLSVLCGRIDQWLETRYPSWVDISRPLPATLEDAQSTYTTDRRIYQLPRKSHVAAIRNAAAADGRPIEPAAPAEGFNREDLSIIIKIAGTIIVALVSLAGLVVLVLTQATKPGGFLGTPVADSPIRMEL